MKRVIELNEFWTKSIKEAILRNDDGWIDWVMHGYLITFIPILREEWVGGGLSGDQSVLLFHLINEPFITNLIITFQYFHYLFIYPDKGHHFDRSNNLIISPIIIPLCPIIMFCPQQLHFSVCNFCRIPIHNLLICCHQESAFNQRNYLLFRALRFVQHLVQLKIFGTSSFSC